MRHGNIVVQEVEFNDNKLQVTAPSAPKLRVNSHTNNGIYYLDRSDFFYKFLIMSHTANTDATVIVPTNEQVPCPIGTSIIICNYETGNIIIEGDIGVTINTPQSNKIEGIYSQATLIKTEINSWELDGNIAYGRQVFIFPHHSSLETRVLDITSFSPPASSAVTVRHIQIVENGSQVHSEDSVKGRSPIWNGPYSTGPDNTIFTNSNVGDLYLRATILTPGAIFNTDPKQVGDTNTYRAAGEWALYTIPHSGNNYDDFKTNPQWKIEQPYDSAIDVEVQIDVSFTDNDSGIIGSFWTIVKTIKYDNFIQTQNLVGTKNYFFMDHFGNITESDNIGGTKNLIGSLTLHPEYMRPIDPWSFNGIYFRVIGGNPTHSGNGVIGTIYNFNPNDTLNDLSFGSPDPGETRTVEVMTDTSGSLQVYATTIIQY